MKRLRKIIDWAVFLAVMASLSLAFFEVSSTQAETELQELREGLTRTAEPLAWEDLHYMIGTLACECPYEPERGIEAVAWVILTRAERKGMTIKETVLKPAQFPCWESWIPDYLKYLRDEPKSALGDGFYKIRHIVIGVLNGNIPNPMPGATHYYSHCLIDPPYWTKYGEFLGEIGCHSFYGLEE